MELAIERKHWGVDFYQMYKNGREAKLAKLREPDEEELNEYLCKCSNSSTECAMITGEIFLLLDDIEDWIEENEPGQHKQWAKESCRKLRNLQKKWWTKMFTAMCEDSPVKEEQRPLAERIKQANEQRENTRMLYFYHYKKAAIYREELEEALEKAYHKKNNIWKSPKIAAKLSLLQIMSQTLQEHQQHCKDTLTKEFITLTNCDEDKARKFSDFYIDCFVIQDINEHTSRIFNRYIAVNHMPLEIIAKAIADKMVNKKEHRLRVAYLQELNLELCVKVLQLNGHDEDAQNLIKANKERDARNKKKAKE